MMVYIHRVGTRILTHIQCHVHIQSVTGAIVAKTRLCIEGHSQSVIAVAINRLKQLHCNSCVLLGIDCDDLSTSAPHHQHSLEPLRQHIKELHVYNKWVESRGGARNDDTTLYLQFSSSFGLLGGPGRLMMTSDESCDLVTISSFSLTLVFMRRTLSSCLHALKKQKKTRS